MSRFKYFFTCFILVTIFSTSVFGQATKCKQCNSKDAPDCAQNPESIDGTCNGGECFTFITDEGYTKRDCEKQDCSDSKKCTSCKDIDLCNSAIFPSDRLKCHQCTGSDCGKSFNSSATPKPCKIYMEDQCYTNVEDDKSTTRGCVSDVGKKCTDGMCIQCPETGCNIHQAESTVPCYECDSQNNNNCKRPTSLPEKDCEIDASTCDEVVLLAREPECFTYQKDNIVQRGCKATKPNDTSTNLSTCKTAKCNKDCVSDAVCYVCDSKKEAQCNADKLDEALKKSCANFVSSCYQCESLDGKRATRGCGVNAEENLVCADCHETGCNSKKLPRSCYVCSSLTDPACTTNGLTPQFCADEKDDCVVMLTSVRATVRNCKSKITDECKEPNCKTCNTHNCNSEVLAKDPLTCYFCDDNAACKNAQTNASKTEVCNSIDGDHCYMFSEDGSKVSRGCVASATAPKECRPETIDSKCVQCNTNGCNEMPYSTASGLSCIQCSGDNEKCPFRFDPKSATKCESQIEYYKIDSCFSVTIGGNVTRGCTSNSTQCSTQNAQCRYCYENGCNTFSTKRSTCVRCRSDNAGQRSCKDKVQIVDKSPCTNAATFESQGCYKENYGGIIIRGCLSDLNSIDFNNCKKDTYKKCIACDEDNCNNLAAPNSSTMAYASFSIVAFCSIFVIKFMI